MAVQQSGHRVFAQNFDRSAEGQFPFVGVSVVLGNADETVRVVSGQVGGYQVLAHHLGMLFRGACCLQEPHRQVQEFIGLKVSHRDVPYPFSP